jgi:Tol biopolymer transport system component
MRGSTQRPLAGSIAVLILAACQPGAVGPSAAPSGSQPAASAEAPTSPSATTTASAPAVVGEGESWIVLQGALQGLTFVRPDGTGNHVILGPPGEQLHPDWSPDGSQIAYVQATEAAFDIWITDPLGSDPKPLLTEDPPDMAGLFWDNPSWSPDGSTIAAVAYEGNPNDVLPTRSLLALVDVASGAVTVAGELASADRALHSFPRWSPDGDALVIVKDRFEGDQYLGGEIAIVSRTGGDWSEPEAITDVVPGPRGDWHPTDDLIVYCTNDVGGLQQSDDPSNLFTIRSDGSGLSQITDYGPGEDRASQPSWTSDGRIIFTHITGATDERLTVAFIDADGSNLETAIGSSLVGLGNRPHPRLRPVP